MKECSFKPKLNVKSTNHSRGHWEVNGMDKIKEKRKKLETQKQEQKMLEDKLFHPEKNYKPRHHTVI